MRRLFSIILMIIFISLISSAENFKAQTKQKVSFTDTTTVHTYEITDIKYPVFISKNGAFYIWKISKKTNKKYKYYLPKDIQIAMGRKYNDKDNK